MSRPTCPPRSRAVHYAAALVAALACVGITASAAQAGDYVVRYCQAGLPLQDWQRLSNAPGALTEDCASGAGTVEVSMAPNNGAAATGLDWILWWPPGVRPIRMRAQANRLLHAGAGEVSGGLRPYGWCVTSSEGACPSGVWTSVSVDRAINEDDGAPGRRLAIGILCSGLSINPCGGGSGVLTVQQLEVVWQDTTLPTGSATVNALSGSPDGGPVRGAHPIEYRAVDGGGSGILRVEARADGRAIAASPDQCAEPYVSMHACPTAAIGQLTIDTSQLDDGAHDLTIVAIDVARNEHVLAAQRIVTQNRDAVGPGSDPELRGVPNGTYAQDDARLAAWWPATGKPRSKSRKVRKRCARSARYRRAHRVACRGKAPGRRLSARFSMRASNTLRGRLLSPTGEAIAGASVRLVATPSSSGAQPEVVGSLTTDATGRFSGRLPSRTGSATYGLQWHARSRDTIPAAMVELHRTVRAATSLAIRPNPTVYRGQRLEFRGQLRGRTGTAQGTAIVIQAHAGNGWRAVTTVRARASGRWTARYRVPRQLRGVYRFRATVKPSAAYPYSTSATKAKRIRVR